MTFLNQQHPEPTFEGILDVIPVAVLVCQPAFEQEQVRDFHCVWGNRQAHEVWSQASQPLVGMSARQLLSGGMLTDSPDCFVRVWETGAPQRFEHQQITVSGPRWLDVSIHKKGERLVISALDTTESKLARQAAEEQSKLFDTVFDCTPAGLALFQPVRNEGGELTDFRFKLVNPANARLVGLSVEQLTEKSLLERFPSAQKQGTFGRLREVLETGVPKHYQSSYQADGLDLWLDAQMVRVNDGVLLTYLDATLLKRQQRALAEQTDQLEERNKQLAQTNTVLTRTNQRLAGLQAVERALLNWQTEQAPEGTALLHTRELVPCDQLIVLGFDQKTGRARTKSWLGDEWEDRQELSLPIRWFKGEALLTGQPWVVNQLEPDAAGIPPQLGLYERGVRSLVVMPLFSQQQYRGVFVLLANRPHFFTADYIQIIKEVASQLAVVLYQRVLDQQLQQQIEHLSTLQNAILQYAGQAIISTDTNGRILTANPAVEQVLGYQAHELIGRRPHFRFNPSETAVPTLTYQTDFVSPTSSFELKPMLERQGYFQTECLAIGKDDRQVPILFVASALQDEAGTIIGYVGIATDISALKAAEENLRQKNQELNTFFKGALDMHCISDSQGKILKINQAFGDALGYSESELMAIPFLHLIHPDEQKFVYHNLLVPILHQPVRHQVNRFRKKDGTYRTIEWNAVGIDELVYGSARDITARQEAESQLRHLNQRLQIATQAGGQGVWEHDIEKGTLIWDDRLCQIHGLETARPNWTFEEFLRMIHPDDLDMFMKHSHLGHQQDRISGVVRIFRPDGTLLYQEYSGLVIRNAEGHPVRVIGVAWDVTEAKLAEAALRESEQRFREIAENVDEVFWIHSAEPFELLYMNPAFERMFGIGAPRSSANSFMNSIVEEDRPLARAGLEKYRQGQEVTVQCRVKGNHPQVRWLQIRTFIMRDNQGKPLRYIGIVNDITSQKEKEQVLEQSLEREQELNKLKSQFVATASHEFRTPLMTIQSSVDLIRLYLPKPQTQELILKHLGVIQQQIENFSGLLSDVLTLGKMEAGKILCHPDLVDVLMLCEQVIDTHFSQQKDERKVQLSVDGAPYCASLDSKLMSHTLVNLLSNAFKFSQDDPQLHLLFRQDELLIQVIDHGIGIPAADLPGLFQTFFRASNTGAIQGTGLGLAIARQFVELQDGQLLVTSEQGQGTTFTIRLPMQPAAAQALPAIHS